MQLSFDAQLKKLLTQITIDSMSTTGDVPVIPPNLYEPLFEVTQSGWYWQIRPVDGAPGRTLVSPSLATAVLPSPYDRKFPTDNTGTRWMNVPGPTGSTIRILEFIDSPGHDPDNTKYSIIVAGPLDWFEETVAKFRTRLTSALALVGLGLLGATVFQVRFGLLPLRRIERGLASIRSGEVERLDGQLPAEIEPLQTELNALIDSNQDIIERARTQVGNLAHALKTPLAVITNEARDDQSAFGAKVAEQAQLMRDQISHYLDRARMAARVGRNRPCHVCRSDGRAAGQGHRTHPRRKGRRDSLHRSAGRKIPGRKAGSRRDARQPPRQRLQVGEKPRLSGSRLSTPAKRPPNAGSCASPSRMTAPASHPSNARKSASAACDWMKPSRVPDWDCRSSATLAASYHGRLALDASEHGGLKAILELPAA